MRKNFFRENGCEGEPRQEQSSFQATLFDYLNEEQREKIRPILRMLKKPAQVDLCVSLLDYLEAGLVDPPTRIPLRIFYYYLTGQDQPFDAPKKPWMIRPLPIWGMQQN